MTTMGLLEMAKDYKTKSIVNITANSSIGKLINRLANKYNLNVINLVRNE